MSYKLWAVKNCVALSGLLLFAVSLIPFTNALHEQGYLFWEWYLLSVSLQIIAGFLLGVPLEVLVNLEKARFRNLIALAIIPIVTFVFFLVLVPPLDERAWWLLWTLVTSVLLGVAVGKALHVIGLTNMDLVKDERIVLDDGMLGFRRKLTLTNKRLLIQQGSGLFKVTWKAEEEITLEEIEEAYVHPKSVAYVCAMMLRLKNGGTRKFNFSLKASESIPASLFGGSLPTGGMTFKVWSITSSWANAINNQIKSNLHDSDGDDVNDQSRPI